MRFDLAKSQLIATGRCELLPFQRVSHFGIGTNSFEVANGKSKQKKDEGMFPCSSKEGSWNRSKIVKTFGFHC